MIRQNGHADHCTCSECAAQPAHPTQPIVFAKVYSGHVGRNGLWHDDGAACDCPGHDLAVLGLPERHADEEPTELKLGTGQELKDLALAFAMRIEELAEGGGELTLRIVRVTHDIEEGPSEPVVVECQNVGPLIGRALALGLRLLGRP